MQNINLVLNAVSFGLISNRKWTVCIFQIFTIHVSFIKFPAEYLQIICYRWLSTHRFCMYVTILTILIKEIIFKTCNNENSPGGLVLYSSITICCRQWHMTKNASVQCKERLLYLNERYHQLVQWERISYTVAQKTSTSLIIVLPRSNFFVLHGHSLICL